MSSPADRQTSDTSELSWPSPSVEVTHVASRYGEQIDACDRADGKRQTEPRATYTRDS